MEMEKKKTTRREKERIGGRVAARARRPSSGARGRVARESHARGEEERVNRKESGARTRRAESHQRSKHRRRRLGRYSRCLLREMRSRMNNECRGRVPEVSETVAFDARERARERMQCVRAT